MSTFKEEYEKRKQSGQAAKETKKEQNAYPFHKEHAHLLEFLQDYDNTYFGAYNLERDYDISRKKAGIMFTSLHERGFIEPWGALGNKTTWRLTDKGKNADAMKEIDLV